MEFTPRTQQILKILLTYRTPVSKQEIADDLGVSKRTVQREFDYLELCIRKYNLKLVNYKGKGVALSGKQEDLDKLQDSLGGQQYPDAADREGRRRRLLFELLRDRTPRKLFYYSQMLGVSEATAGSDMDALCEWLEESHLDIVRRPGYGVILEGEERYYREAMRRFIEETAGQSEAYSSGDINGEIFAEALLNAADSGIYSLLEGDTVRRVDKVLRELNEPKISACNRVPPWTMSRRRWETSNSGMIMTWRSASWRRWKMSLRSLFREESFPMCFCISAVPKWLTPVRRWNCPPTWEMTKYCP